MVDVLAEEPTHYQPPTLTELEEARAGVELARWADVEWLVAPEAPAVRVLADLLSRAAWHRQAACAGQGTTELIPVRGANYDRARALCAGCPVRQECLETALADSELLGLWAGTTPDQRKAMRRGVA